MLPHGSRRYLYWYVYLVEDGTSTHPNLQLAYCFGSPGEQMATDSIPITLVTQWEQDVGNVISADRSSSGFLLPGAVGNLERHLRRGEP